MHFLLKAHLSYPITTCPKVSNTEQAPFRDQPLFLHQSRWEIDEKASADRYSLWLAAPRSPRLYPLRVVFQHAPSTATVVVPEYRHPVSNRAAKRWLDGENG